MSPTDLNALVSRFCSSPDGERRKILSRLLLDSSSTLPGNMDLVGFAMTLRQNGELRWAEAAFALAATVPHQRHVAQYELAVLWALQDKIQPALTLFMEVWQERGLTPAQQIQVARQFARAGDYSKARALLDGCFADDKLYHQVIAERAFFNYLERFPRSSALALFEKVTAAYNVESHETVFDRLQTALERGEPMSVIRLGDGEGIYLQISCADECEFYSLYRRGRTEFHTIWYSGQDLIDDIEFLGQMRKVQAAYANADCLSMLHRDGINNQYNMGSPRGIPALNNMLRFLDGLGSDTPRPKVICNSDISRNLLVKGRLATLLTARPFLGLVSCYTNLPDLLMSRFGVGEVELHRTCGENIALQTFASEASSRQKAQEFLSSHHRTCDALKRVRPGELYLVAAGIFGKLYCNIIKQGGGIALDIGSVADIWTSVPTRRFTKEEKKHVLI